MIHKDNAEKIQAEIILELANGPTTSEATEILSRRRKLLIPDILANSGGVCVSYFEWYQNMKSESWSKEQVLEKLSKQIRQAFADVLDVKNKYQTNFRNAAYILAAGRIIAEMK